jgi:tetratricopeptide (TPR) repeat protein
MTRPVLFLTLVTLVAALAPVPARSQTVDTANVREFIERNAELLDVAATLVQETNSTKARGSLDTARALHAQSIKLLEENRPGLAARVALRTREVIQQTIALAKREARLEEQALKAIERAAFRLEQARTAFEDAGSRDAAARRLLLEANDNLRRARQQLQQHTFEVSLNLAESSAALSLRALRLLRHDLVDAEDVQDEIERTEHVLERLADVRPALPPALVNLADRAIDLQAQARAGAVAGDVAIARERTLAARSLGLRALRVASGGETSAENVERAVAATDDILERARELTQETGDRHVAERMADASRAQDAARHSLAQSEFEVALRQTMRARAIVRDALGGSSASVDVAAVETALARTDELLGRLQNALESHDDAQARDVLRRARARQEEARHAFADGDPRRALALTKVANNLAREGLRLLGDVAF